MVQQVRAQLIKGALVRLCENESRAILLPDVIDCQDYNALHVHVIPFGTSPSCVVEIQGSYAEGGVYIPLSDPNALQTITAEKSFEVVVGTAFVRVNLQSVTSGSFTITATPYISPGQAQLSVITMQGA